MFFLLYIGETFGIYFIFNLSLFNFYFVMAHHIRLQKCMCLFQRLLVDLDGKVIRADRTYMLQVQRTLRLSGKQFIHRSGALQPPRQMRPACDPNVCRMKCSTRISDELRSLMFNSYYALANLPLQWQFLAQHSDRTVPKIRDRPAVYKRSSTTATASQPPLQRRRQNNVRYFLKDVDTSERIFVCKSMFLATFDIGETSVATALQKTDTNGQLIDYDRRGRRKTIAKEDALEQGRL